MPIRVACFAIDDHSPHTDLYLSPLHRARRRRCLVDSLPVAPLAICSVSGPHLSPPGRFRRDNRSVLESVTSRKHSILNRVDPVSLRVAEDNKTDS
jgi:hypothetical protein